jgi:hypothetical protein
MSKPYQERLIKAMDLADSKPNKALELLGALIKDFPTEMQPRFERAMVLLNLDDEKAAIRDLECVLQSEPEYPGARDWFARVSSGQGKVLLAAEVKLADLLAKPPDHWSANGQAWADCTGYFLQAREPARALAALGIYFERYEGRQRGYEVYAPAPYRMRARALLATNRPTDALAAIDIACAHPNSVPADKFVRVQVLLALGMQSEASAAFALLSDFRETDPYVETTAYAQSLGVHFERP